MKSLNLSAGNLISVFSVCIALATGLLLLAMQAGVSQVNADDKLAASDRLLRHVVMFKFKDESSKEDVQNVVDAFGQLKDKIPAIYAYEHGTDNSPEGLADGFTHCFLVTFKSEADRDAYLPHPQHKAFVDILKPHLEKVMVIDYWTQK